MTAYQQEAWSLEDLFSAPDAPEVQDALEKIDRLTEQFEAHRERLSPDLEPSDFNGILEDYEALVLELSRLLGYSGLRFSADTQDQRAQADQARFRELAAGIENRILFFKLWWKSLEDEEAQPFLDEAGDNRYFLEALRLERPYTLSEDEEKIINVKDVNGPMALLTLYSTITDRYEFKLDVDGQEETLNREQLSVYYRHPDPDLRAAAYQELYRVYEADKAVLGQIYQYRVRDWRSEQVGLRGFAAPISVRNLGNDIPDSVVDILLDVSKANAPLFQRYFRLKAKWIGMDKLRRYDIYAPVVKTREQIEYQEAVDLVLGSFRRFDPQVAEMAERLFAERHYDSEVRSGKQGGAFCATITPGLTPWILQSFNGRPDDVATMAHELGHAIHAMLADHHSVLTHHSSLPLAETASTFGEMLVIDRVLASDPDPETRRDLLFRQMDTNYATIMRQAFFAIFEKEAHDLIKEGAIIDDLSQLYFDNLREQFGDALDLSDDFRFEWLAIPHLYRVPFYVYAYAFGQLLVLALYQQYLEEGESFKPRYLELLAAGGSDAPVRILDRAGIDVRSESFWQGGYDVLANSLNLLEELEIPA